MNSSSRSVLLTTIVFVVIVGASLWLGVSLIGKNKLVKDVAEKNSPMPNDLDGVGENKNQDISKELGKPSAVGTIFGCDERKNIQATFHDGSSSVIDLILSDGRTLVLSQTVSASGARYTTEDETVVFWNKGGAAFIEEGGKTTFANCSIEERNNQASAEERKQMNGMANPASVNCTKKGGRLEIQKKKDDSEYGLCYFEDNMACEEWAMMRGDCPVGGVKTTGFDTVSQRFCAWSGGKTTATENAVCEFPDGTSCSADDFYGGICQRKTTSER